MTDSKDLKIIIIKYKDNISSFDITGGSLILDNGHYYGAIGYLNVDTIPTIKKWIAITEKFCIFVEFKKLRNNVVYGFGTFSNDIKVLNLCPSTLVEINLNTSEDNEKKEIGIQVDI